MTNACSPACTSPATACSSGGGCVDRLDWRDGLNEPRDAESRPRAGQHPDRHVRSAVGPVAALLRTSARSRAAPDGARRAVGGVRAGLLQRAALLALALRDDDGKAAEPDRRL